eukprot:6196243-Pleurochrysis_carterae.AAC.1
MQAEWHSLHGMRRAEDAANGSRTPTRAQDLGFVYKSTPYTRGRAPLGAPHEDKNLHHRSLPTPLDDNAAPLVMSTS